MSLSPIVLPAPMTSRNRLFRLVSLSRSVFYRCSTGLASLARRTRSFRVTHTSTCPWFTSMLLEPHPLLYRFSHRILQGITCFALSQEHQRFECCRQVSPPNSGPIDTSAGTKKVVGLPHPNIIESEGRGLRSQALHGLFEGVSAVQSQSAQQSQHADGHRAYYNPRVIRRRTSH